MRVTGLGNALGALAAHRLYDVVEILFPVMIREFLAYPDRALGHDKHSSITNFNLAIRAAGVIDEARYVFLVPAIYCLFFGDLEEVAVAAVKPFVSFEYGADIFNDACPFWDRLKRKQTAPCMSALDSNTISAGSETRRHHERKLLVWKQVGRGELSLMVVCRKQARHFNDPCKFVKQRFE